MGLARRLIISLGCKNEGEDLRRLEIALNVDSKASKMYVKND